MILYFSATGNSQYAAEQIARAVGDTARSIEGDDGRITLREGELFGLVTPTYAWELPLIVRVYLRHLRLTAPAGAYVFVLATYGTTPGAAGADAAHLLKKNDVSVSALYSLQMPDTWTPIFDLSDAEKVRAQNARADEALAGIIEDIQNRRTGNRMRRAMPYPVRFAADFYYDGMRRTKHFSVAESCVGCGLCARGCPAQAIRMENGRPVWVKDRCVMCLRCLHRCPKFAIRYGGSTAKHGQYTHPGTAR